MLTLCTRRSAAHVAGLAALVMASSALAGCASPQAGAATEPGLDVQDDVGDITFDLSADAVSGTGPTGYPGLTFPIPEGARSVTVTFECEGDEFYSVELGDSMMLGQGTLHGLCEGTAEFSWPLTAQTQSRLAVLVADGAAWTATPSFSADEFLYDDALRADCSAYSAVYSAFVNADTGVTFYETIDDTEWAERVERAANDLGELAQSAQSELAATLTTMHDSVSASSPVVGNSLGELEAGELQIRQSCNANHTPVIVMAEFGG